MPRTIEAYTDGACRVTNPGLASCAFVVYIDGQEHHSAKFFLGDCVTNNVAEYLGLINLLEWADANKITGITIRSDSQLIVNQVNGRWNCRMDLLSLRAKAYALLIRGSHTLKWVRGHNGEVGNERVDALCNQALDEVQGKKAK